MALRTDPDTLVAVAVMLGSAALLCFLGHRIRHGETSLIAGYQPQSVADEDAVTALVGTTTVALGVVTAAYGLAMLVFEAGVFFWGSYVAIYVLALLLVQVRGRQYAA